MKIRKIFKSIFSLALAAVITFSFFGCGKPKNAVSEGFDKFNKISDNEIIEEDGVTMTTSDDKKRLSYTYIFSSSDGTLPISLTSSADKKSKELIDLSLWFVGVGRGSDGVIAEGLKNKFAGLAESSLQAFAGLTEEEAKAVIEELKMYDSASYNGKTSTVKTTEKYRFSFTSNLVITGFTIKPISAESAGNSN